MLEEMPGNYIVITNFILYLSTFILAYYKRKTMTVGVLLLLSYTVTAGFCLFNYNSDPNNFRLSFFPLFYLYIVIIILLTPILNDKLMFSRNPIAEKHLRMYKLISYGYILISLFSCVVYIPEVINIIQNPNWQELYLDAHEAQDTSILVKFANLFFHLRYLGIVLLFSFLVRKNSGALFLVTLAISAILPVVLGTIKDASRGGFVALILSVVFVYLMFSNLINPKIKKRIKVIAPVFLVLSMVYLSAVTIARFEDSPFAESAQDSVISYLGHSMLRFADGIYDTISRHSWGGFMFNYEDIKRLPLLDSYYGTHFGTSFFTIVGALYLDFGLVGTLAVAVLISFFFNKVSRKKSKDIADVFILLTYVMIIFNGVFVLGRGYGIQWIEALLIYLLLKFLQRTRIKRVSIR